MDEIWYYTDNQTAVATVRHADFDPNFTLKPSNDLLDKVCPKCLNSSNGQLLVDLGLLALELDLTEENITMLMSWELHSSWVERCGEGLLTWVYSLESSKFVKVVG